ncbi:hypothetical protein PC9H_001997 [Pleurotus ostreatus]|uniref:SMP-30/Gluconolactonase/LRE-like region domain-containing protein n=1 Tax=Pleurotus ostreatus TaxID=5322 RepID=A0A8H7DMP6_PLEOS|nr:uncharacterized protein PC9H_001997 [Pleurotus ostreatus]KAF7419407.1 hypothetical protein PC9H_001997 [Pleurotus ostreatus]
MPQEGLISRYWTFSSKLLAMSFVFAGLQCNSRITASPISRMSPPYLLQSQSDTNRLRNAGQFVDPRSFSVIGQNGTFRASSFEGFFNPTSTTPPFFQIFDQEFLKVLGASPSLTEIASNPGFAFAHEAPIYVPETDELFFASNDGGPLGMSDLDHNNEVSKISMAEVEAALARKSSSPVNVTVTPLNLSDTIQMTNGGTGPFRSQLLLVNSGRGPLPPNIALVNPKPPFNSTIILDNFFGRQFNSLNDVKIHPSGKIFFTDVTYGFLNNFRPAPLMPNQVYRLDPDTRAVRVVADGFDKCNGIAFTADGNTAYISDTGATGGNSTQTEPSTVYAFDVDPISHAFKNRRVLAYVDAGVPDGIQVDTNGNIYSGTGDGVQTWNSEGTLLGKFFLGTTSANMVFAGKGRLVILAETKIFLAKIAAEGFDLGGN